MRPIISLALLTLMALSACQMPEVKLEVSLTADAPYPSYPLAISVSTLREHGITSQAGNPWAPFVEGSIVPFQYEDHDQDGEADVLFMLIDLAANQAKEITFKTTEFVPDFTAQTHLRLGKKTAEGLTSLNEAPRLNTYTNTETQATYQMEGVGWENDKVAFRNYLDLRNGIDIFGKTTSDMILDRVGAKGDESYHHLQEWGMDILKVGSTLGAGSIGFWYQDSLYRLTSAESGYKALFEGPLRSRFELYFKNVDLGDKAIDVTHTISIVPGPYGYDASLSISDPTDLTVVVGLVDLHGLPANSLQSEANQALYTYGLQSENKDSLGMAVVIPAEEYLGTLDTDTVSVTIPNTYALLMDGENATYRFYAGWEASSKAFDNQASFENYLKKELPLWNQPVKMVWSK